jgi:SAM-dependent methyltransferase
MADPAITWHHGLVARWWAEFERDGPEIDYFQQLIRAHGEPALDAGCGTGRLLLPAVAEGLDVDGCDVSADMLSHAGERAASEGLSVELYEQAMHELDLPRRYRTIFVCGSLGIGGGREIFEQSLRRFHRHLEPGGVLVIDKIVAGDGEGWETWVERRGAMPQPWPESRDTRRAADGSEFELRTRRTEIDIAARVTTREMSVRVTRDAETIEETHTLHSYTFFEDELITALQAAGFAEVSAEEGYVSSDGRRTRVVVARA